MATSVEIPTIAGTDRLDAAKLASLLGVSVQDLPPQCLETLDDERLLYRTLLGVEREDCFLEAMRPILADSLEVSGPKRREHWEAGWSENLTEFRKSGFSTDRLRPKYVRHKTLRLCGQYIRVADPAFEDIVFTALRQYLFARYLPSVESVVEFGCGTGTSLLTLGMMFPETRMFGCDWATASQEILGHLAEQTGYAIRSKNVDMFAPDHDLEFPRGAAAMTFTAMEQLGTEFETFAEYLLSRQPSVCIHVEPTSEFYAEDDAFDFLALRYHQQRNYLTGFLPWLRTAESRGTIEILEARRLGFGSFFHEGYSVLVWKPCS